MPSGADVPPGPIKALLGNPVQPSGTVKVIAKAGSPSIG